MKTIFSAVVVGAALTLAAPVQAADGFNILLGGSGWKIPSCKQGRVLREVRDQQTGKLVWRCVDQQQQTAQSGYPAPRRR
jgi:hypothetical protein